MEFCVFGNTIFFKVETRSDYMAFHCVIVLTENFE